MAERKECEVCREMQRKKHKYDIIWKVIAVVSTIIAIIFICLYATKGSLVKTTEVNNNVKITNDGEQISNENIGNFNGYISSDNTELNEQDKDSLTVGLIVVVVAVVVALGGGYVGYFISQNHNKQQHRDNKQDEEEKEKSEN